MSSRSCFTTKGGESGDDDIVAMSVEGLQFACSGISAAEEELAVRTASALEGHSVCPTKLVIVRHTEDGCITERSAKLRLFTLRIGAKLFATNQGDEASVSAKPLVESKSPSEWWQTRLYHTPVLTSLSQLDELLRVGLDVRRSLLDGIAARGHGPWISLRQHP